MWSSAEDHSAPLVAKAALTNASLEGRLAEEWPVSVGKKQIALRNRLREFRLDFAPLVGIRSIPTLRPLS